MASCSSDGNAPTFSKAFSSRGLQAYRPKRPVGWQDWALGRVSKAVVIPPVDFPSGGPTQDLFEAARGTQACEQAQLSRELPHAGRGSQTDSDAGKSRLLNTGGSGRHLIAEGA